MRILLASKSPRRKALLALLSDDFAVVPNDVAEADTGEPCARAVESARRKAHAVRANGPVAVLGADTIVVLDDHIMGKPSSREEAAKMLRQLSGRSHRVLTGLHVWTPHTGRSQSACVETEVRFRKISEQEIQRYLDSGEFADKAGAYGIQGRAAAFVEHVVGEYTNVVGLPLCALSRLLQEIDVTP